jgi:hypothetical protein
MQTGKWLPLRLHLRPRLPAQLEPANLSNSIPITRLHERSQIACTIRRASRYKTTIIKHATNHNCSASIAHLESTIASNVGMVQALIFCNLALRCSCILVEQQIAYCNAARSEWLIKVEVRGKSLQGCSLVCAT